MKNYTMRVVSHTHWDREWYLPFQQFRLKLVDMIDNLLHILDTDPDFRCFHLDGQTIVLEDYLEIRLQNEAKLRKYIKAGRILVGPWYQLNDETLVSGESTIRSLLVGHRIASDFGGVMKVGYLPDQFGHISQMPQIFREFGIDSIIFGRGLQLVDDEKMELIWASPDGSEVLASLMMLMYNAAHRFPKSTDEALQYAEDLKGALVRHAATSELLLMNGGNHLGPQKDLTDILKRVNAQLDGDKIVHSTMPEYIDAVRDDIRREHIDLHRVKGELRHDRNGNILAGTLSNRMHLKQSNNAAEVALEKYAEPSSSFSWMLGGKYPAEPLNYTWKLLMKNQPHDSICGCSTDPVHDAMMARFAEVTQICDALTKRSLDSIAACIKTRRDSIVVVNPLSWSRTDALIADVDFEVGDPVRGKPTMDPLRDIIAIEILDHHGQSVPYKLLDRRIVAKQVFPPDDLAMGVMVRRFTVKFVAEDVPGCGFKTYEVYPVDSTPDFDDSLVGLVYDQNTVSNGLITMNRCSGGIAVYDETSDVDEPPIYSELGIIADGGDAGDAYSYVRPLRDAVVTTLDGTSEVTLIDDSPVSATLKVQSTMTLPASASPDGQGRSSETVECRVTSSFTITAKSPRVDIVTDVENVAKDHRLRVLFPSGIDTDVAHAESQFDVVDRSIRPPKDWKGASTFFPQRSWVDLNDGTRGLTIINKGLPEYEVYDDEARTIALTLLRCVGVLSGSETVATVIPTPGAQCPGSHRFEYAMLPHAGTWMDARVWQQAHGHNVPFIYTQTGAHNGHLPAEYSFIEVSPAELIVTAVKKAEDRDSLMVRFFNIADEPVHEARIRVKGAVSANVANLNEEKGRELEMEADGAVLIDVPARKIATLEFILGEEISR